MGPEVKGYGSLQWAWESMQSGGLRQEEKIKDKRRDFFVCYHSLHRHSTVPLSYSAACLILFQVLFI